MADKKPVFLDVDTNIIEKNLTLEECQTDLNEYKALLGINDGGSAPWKLVTPTPAFCVKTYDAEKKKVFVNFCTIDEIPEPKNVSEMELVDIIEQEDPSFRMPLSLQEPHEELDKSGKPAMCYDVAINPNFYKKVQESGVFKLFLLQVTFDGIKDKFDVDLDIKDYVILNYRKCIGSLKPHRIRTTPAPLKAKKTLVEEVNAPIKNTSTAKKEPKPVQKKKLHYRFMKNKLGDTEYLYGKVHLPKAVSGEDISLEVGEDRIIIGCQSDVNLLDVFFPMRFDQDKIKSEFALDTRLLHIWLPVV